MLPAVGCTICADPRPAERMARAAAWLYERAQGLSELWVLAPTRRAADDFLLLSTSLDDDPRPLIGAHRATPAQLADRLARLPLAKAGRAPTRALSTRGLVERAIQSCALSHFSAIERTPGFLPAACRTVETLRQGLIRPAQLMAGGPAAQDLARLLVAYEAELERERLADAADRIGAAIEAHPRLPPILMLDLPLQSEVERRWIAHLLRASEEAWVSLPPLPEAERAWWAAASDATSIASPEAEQGTAPKLGEAGRLSLPEGVALDFFSAASEVRECAEIVRQVRRFALDGVRFDQMAVFLRDPRRYQPLLQDAFSRAEIPVFATRSLRRPRPAGRALLSLLHAASEGLSAARFSEYLSFGQVPPVAEDGAPDPARALPWVPPRDDGQLVFFERADPPRPAPAPPPPEAAVVEGQLQAPQRWLALLVEASVIGGDPARWRRRLAGLKEELSEQLKLLERQDEPSAADKRRELRDLGHLTAFCLPVIDALAALPARAPWPRWLQLLKELAALCLAEPEPVIALLSELSPLRGMAEIDPAELLRVLHEPLSELPPEPDLDRYGKVFLAPPEAAAGRLFSVVFVPGLVEGGFPRSLREDPLLPDAEAGPLGLPTLAEQAAAERRAIRLVALAAERQLVASYPRVDMKRDRPRVPSIYALELLAGPDGALPSLDALSSEAIAGRDSPGWPAPKDPAEAIDRVEYNLAVLAPLVYMDQEALAGRGAYLVSGDPEAPWVRSLRMLLLRQRPHFTRADGLVANAGRKPALARSLAPARLTAAAYSPTTFEQFAVCPYRFALKGLFGLRRPERAEPLTQLDPLTRGSLIHDILFHFFTAEKQQPPLSTERLPEALAALQTCVEERFAHYEERLAPAVASIWSTARTQTGLDLAYWLSTRARSADAFDGAEGWLPVGVEYAFGLPPSPGHDVDSRRTPAKLEGGVLLRGVVDLLERSAASGRLRVVDYKTGGDHVGERAFVVRRGRTLQPLLYAAAMQSIQEEPVTSGELDFCTRRGRFKKSVVNVNQASRAALQTALTTIDRAIAEAFLPVCPATPADCTRCDFISACPAETRARDKKDGRLNELIALRRMK